MKEAIILAGGRGTRIQSILPDTAKCMAPIAGKPFINYLIDYLLAEGVDRFIFALGYLHQTVSDYIKKQYPDLDSEFIIEKEALGTGGAVANAIKFTEGPGVFILNADTYFPVSLKLMEDVFDSSQADLVIASTKLIQPFRFGTLTIDPDQRITQFNEKQELPIGYINGGCYLIRRQKLISSNLPIKFSFEKDLLEPKCEEWKIFASVQNSEFIDIGIPEDYSRAQQLFETRSKSNWTLFLDRDGVINELIPNDYVKKPEAFKFKAYVREELAQLSRIFRYIIVVTNQQGVGKGLMNDLDLESIHQMMVQEIKVTGGHITKIYSCTHLKEEDCACRKPKSGMIQQALADYPDISVENSILIGDNETDMQVALQSGIRAIALVDTESSIDGWIYKPEYTVTDLKDFRLKVLPLLKGID